MSAEKRITRPTATILVCVAVAFGCHRGSSATSTTSTGPTPLTPQQMAIKKIPVLARTVTQQELSQLAIYMNQYQAEHGKYPTTMQDLQELSVPRDLPKVAKAVQDGDLVLAGGTGGVLAYEKKALTDRGNVLTTNGIQVMSADELNKLLGR